MGVVPSQSQGPGVEVELATTVGEEDALKRDGFVCVFGLRSLGGRDEVEVLILVLDQERDVAELEAEGEPGGLAEEPSGSASCSGSV